MTGNYLSLLVTLAFTLTICKVKPCEVKVEKVGCFADKFKPRALEELLINRRHTYHHEKQSEFLPRLVCDCAVKAQSRQYKYIGLQFYAECWSSSSPWPDYDQYGRSNRCFNASYAKCGDEETECVGGGFSNFVYKIIHTYSGRTTSTTKSSTLATMPGGPDELPYPTAEAKTVLSPDDVSEPTNSVTEKPVTSPLDTHQPASPTAPTSNQPTNKTRKPTSPKTTLKPIRLTTQPTSLLTTHKPTTSTAKPTAIQFPTSTQVSCEDKLPHCFDNKPYCTPTYPDMLEKCPKTCGTCN